MPRRSPALIFIHVVWATSRRRPVLPRSLDDQLLNLLAYKAREKRCMLLAGGCAPDHVHAVVRLASSVSLGALVMHLKGSSAYELHRKQLLPRQVFWQDGYWAESLGPHDLEPILRYVRGQRLHHDLSHPAECWQAGDSPPAGGL